MVERPCFLVGAERSGSTLLRLMLMHHPQIAWSSEFEYAVDLLDGKGWPDLAAYTEYLTTDRVFERHGHKIDPALSYPELVDSFLEHTREQQGNKPIIGASVHRHFDHLLRIWPDARFIHLLRDGRDVARSCIAKGWAGNYYHAVERWQHAEQVWDAMIQHLTPDRYVDIRYEDLTSDPEGQLRRICTFLGVDYDPAMLEYTKGTRFDAPDPRLNQRWRKSLSEDEIRLAESQIGPLLTARGYDLSGHPPLEVSDKMLRQLERQNRWSRLRHRVQRYGPWLYLQMYVSRRVGPRSWRDRVQRRANAVVNAGLK